MNELTLGLNALRSWLRQLLCRHWWVLILRSQTFEGEWAIWRCSKCSKRRVQGPFPPYHPNCRCMIPRLEPQEPEPSDDPDYDPRPAKDRPPAKCEAAGSVPGSCQTCSRAQQCIHEAMEREVPLGRMPVPVASSPNEEYDEEDDPDAWR